MPAAAEHPPDAAKVDLFDPAAFPPAGPLRPAGLLCGARTIALQSVLRTERF
jgi:hypothetical protein